MKRNRFMAEPKRNRSQTWMITDRSSGNIVMDHLSPDAAKDWVKSMNASDRAGEIIHTLSETLEPTAKKNSDKPVD